jgi:hypothetical protein
VGADPYRHKIKISVISVPSPQLLSAFLLAHRGAKERLTKENAVFAGRCPCTLQTFEKV